MKVKDFVSKGNFVIFGSYRNGVFYYNIPHVETLKLYQFQVPIEDVSGVTLLCRDKSITFMRWIRKSIEDNTLIKL